MVLKSYWKIIENYENDDIFKYVSYNIISNYETFTVFCAFCPKKWWHDKLKQKY